MLIVLAMPSHSTTVRPVSELNQTSFRGRFLRCVSHIDCSRLMTDKSDMESSSSDGEPNNQPSEGHKVLVREWMQKPIDKAKQKHYSSFFGFLVHIEAQSMPQIDLSAARPPAVRQWEGFWRQVETCFESYPWPCLHVPPSICYVNSGTHSDMVYTLSRLSVSFAISLVCLGKTNLSERKTSEGLLVHQLNSRDLMLITAAYPEEASELDNADLLRYKSATSKNRTRRLIERLYGQLVWAGVLYGAYITEETCTFLHIDPKDGSLMVSPSIRHDAKDATAKQGMFYLATLAIKQPTVNILANIGPRKPLAALVNNFSKLFRGLNNMQVISIEDIRLGERLGLGNAARVYSAHMHDVPSAIKVAHVDGRFDHEYRSMRCADRLVIEIKTYEALKALQGNIIPKLHAYGLIENRAGDFLPFLAMEKINGRTLDTAIDGLSEEAVPGAIKAVINAFNKLHAAGYTQGSVKPLNVMLTEHGRAVIIDFGRGEKLVDCRFERRQVRDMLESLVKTKLKLLTWEETEEKLKLWEDELSNGEETPSSDETANFTKTKKFAGCPCSKDDDATDLSKALATAMKCALEAMPFKQTCWSEGGGNRLPVVARVRGKKRLQWTATGKQLVSRIKKYCELLMDPRTRGRKVAADTLLMSQLQSKLCKQA